MNHRFNKFIVGLSRCIGQRRLYFATHPLIATHCGDLVAELRKILTELGEETLFIGVYEGQLIHDGHYLVGPSIMGQQLVDFAGKLHCGGFAFGLKTTVHEVQMLLDLAGEEQTGIKTFQDSRNKLRSFGVVNITLAGHYSSSSSLVPEEESKTWQGDGRETNTSALHAYQGLFDVVDKNHSLAALGRSVDIVGSQAMSEKLLGAIRSSYTDMLQFVQYPDYDSYTVGHSVRVATLAVSVGNNLGLADEQLLDLGTAALLHDLGKSKVPASILFKAGRLTEDEFAIMRAHPKAGAEILLSQRESTSLQVAAAWGHHLRYDGGGYPDTPSWAVRSHLVALLQICDVFEALTAIRPYKQPLAPQAAFSIMLGDKGGYHPALLHAFISLQGLYPPGSNIRLSNGCQATVVAVGQSIDKPVVKLLTDSDGRKLGKGQHSTLNLGSESASGLTVAELVTVS